MELYFIAIVLVAAIGLYVIERWSKGKEVDVADAGKIGLAASALTGGIVFALDSGAVEVPVAPIVDSVSSAAATAVAAVESVQDMFVGKPAF